MGSGSASTAGARCMHHHGCMCYAGTAVATVVTLMLMAVMMVLMHWAVMSIP